SIMIDGSKFDLATNIKMVNEVINYTKGQTIEAEVGHIGGTEEDLTNNIAYAKTEDCLTLVKNTNIDSLAPALGSVHGIYKGLPQLDFNRMKEIKQKTKLPLVLHGGTGIPDDLIKKAINNGICKININTELQIVWSNEIKKFISNNDKIYDPRKIISSGQQEIKKVVKAKIILFGSQNKA
ncbi:MAG: class II fructose-bisphosphate aldolase, partial [Bacilli bacterium]